MAAKGAAVQAEAGTGAWNVSGDATTNVWVNQTVYVNIGPTQGPLVVYRIHNDGPETVFAGNATEGGALSGAAIRPGCDCDISGSPIEIGLSGLEPTGSASGTYELVCCQSGPVTVQPSPPPPPPPSG
jgi:hypothetical protein